MRDQYGTAYVTNDMLTKALDNGGIEVGNYSPKGENATKTDYINVIGVIRKRICIRTSNRYNKW